MSVLSSATPELSATQETASSPWTRTLCGLFFLSGFPALIYQLVWQRALFRILGVNIESVTIVVTAFMLGLGLGSLLGGWLSRRRALPLLLLLATIELLTACFGLVSLRLFEQVGELALGQTPVLVAGITLGLVIVPTLLMGATLPVLVGQLSRRLGNVGSSLGLLYYVNTLGAGAACLISVIALFPLLGMQHSINVAVVSNITVALGAIIADRRYRKRSNNLASAPPPKLPFALLISSFPVVLALACAGGWISLSYEIFFFRIVSYATGSSPAAFAATLGAFLIGLASGSREGGEFCLSTDRNLLIRRVTMRLLLAGGVGVLFLPLLAHLAWLGQAILGLALIMVYVLARCWGVLLPCLAHCGVVADAKAGMRTALLYLANIAGSALGTIFTGFILMEYFGVVGLAQLLVAAAMSYAVLFMVATGSSRRTALLQAGAGATLVVSAIISISVFAENVLEALLYKGAREADTRFAHVVENRSGIITVDRSGTVFGNGAYDGHFSVDLVHDNNGIVRPFALSLFHSAPRDVLMIGFSSGSWAQVIANNPAVQSLTIVEINPGYSGLVEQAPQTASVLRNPKVKLVADDGRRWLRLNDAKHFDLIVANTTYHFRAQATNLLSAEFLELVKSHLKPDGIFFYNTTGSDRVQRTGCLGFPFGARFTNHMVLSSAPLAWDFERWRTALEGYRIDNRPVFDLAAAEDRKAMDQLMSLQASFNSGATSGRDTPIETCSHILGRTAHLAPVTDDNMGTEWRYFWGWE